MKSLPLAARDASCVAPLLRTTAITLCLCATPGLAQEWSFTDGAGDTITLPNPPERIVVFSASAAGLMQFGITPTGIFVDSTVPEKSYAEFDLDGITVIETPWNELNPESLAALDPDLIVTEYWPHNGGYSGGEDMGPDGRFADVAQIVGIEQGDSVMTNIENYAALAEALGADLEAPEIAASRAAFEQARAALEDAAREKPGLKVAAGRFGGDNFVLGVPAGAAELQDFARWGLDIVTPDAAPGDYWAFLSWEEADTYPIDVLLVDDRYGTESRDAILAHPLSNMIGAVEAGQVGDWPAWWIRTYSSYASELEELTALIESSEVVTR